ncbi:MAG TPA: hypothetical protein VJL85_05515, partial [Gaiellaceae bacterium]|nr:hypothetical protein [Gaiellaceae bacterium]
GVTSAGGFTDDDGRDVDRHEPAHTARLGFTVERRRYTDTLGYGAREQPKRNVWVRTDGARGLRWTVCLRRLSATAGAV